MAEQFLYHNHEEPKFPFEAIRPQLSWLQGYLDEHITCPPYDMEPFINTILVFGRARTATLQGSFWWRDIRDLVTCLNVALKSINALEHKLELVIRGHGFFVTCSQSPRFIWKTNLTHRDVGRNLDYFAPGHMANDKPTLAVHMVETGTMQLIVAESILESALDDLEVRERFREFNQQRTNLFNSTMQEFGLRYRFKCVVFSPRSFESIPKIISNIVPPQQAWWDDHWAIANGSFIPGTHMDSRFAFCGPQAKYDDYWQLIGLVFDFLSRYGRDDFWYTSDETGVEFWMAVDSICHRVRAKCDEESCPEDIDRFFDIIEAELSALADQAEKPSKTPYSGESRPYLPPRFKKQVPRVQRYLAEIEFKLRGMKMLAHMYLFKRHKLKNRLLRQVLNAPAIADLPAWRPLR